MGTLILACRTLARELYHAMERHKCTYPVIWLEAGDHNVPAKRRNAIANALAQYPEYDTVLLAMSFCGGALTGLDSGNHTLVLPCFDDCIELLLCEPRCPDTYYLTGGWLDGERNILVEYERSLKRYGKERTERIFGAMLRHYRAVAYLESGGSHTGQDTARRIAELFHLSFRVETASTRHLEALVTGNWENFSVITPHTRITAEIRRGG